MAKRGETRSKWVGITGATRITRGDQGACAESSRILKRGVDLRGSSDV